MHAVSSAPSGHSPSTALRPLLHHTLALTPQAPHAWPAMGAWEGVDRASRAWALTEGGMAATPCLQPPVPCAPGRGRLRWIHWVWPAWNVERLNGSGGLQHLGEFCERRMHPCVCVCAPFHSPRQQATVHAHRMQPMSACRDSMRARADRQPPLPTSSHPREAMAAKLHVPMSERRVEAELTAGAMSPLR